MTTTTDFPHNAATQAGTPLLSLRGITKTFGALNALTDITLDVAAGEVVALVGDNGAGKSTLVKVLSGVYAPDAGTIAFAATAMTSRAARSASRRCPLSSTPSVTNPARSATRSEAPKLSSAWRRARRSLAKAAPLRRTGRP